MDIVFKGSLDLFQKPFPPFPIMMIGAMPIFLIYSNIGEHGQTKQIDWINRYQLLMDCKKNIE
jgi:hypothetical protein